MKDTKRRVEFFSFYNRTGIEQHLTKMAKQGWLIESITNFYWTYRKIEPKEIHFSVSYYPRASDFDPEPTEEQQTFHDFCAHTGWTYACTWFQMQVFYNEQENPIPLDTDPVMELDVLHKACKKNFLPGYFLLFYIVVPRWPQPPGGLRWGYLRRSMGFMLSSTCNRTGCDGQR